MLRLLACAGLLVASTSFAAAPNAAPDPALTKAVTSAQEAARKLDWKKYSELTHPDSLKEFRGILVPVIEATKKAKSDPAGLLEMFDGAKDLDTILTWKPEEFFARFMKSTTANEAIKSIYASTKSKVIGTVREGDEQAHAVIRTTRTYGKVEIKRVEVVTLKKHGTTWKLTVGDEARGLAETIKRSLPGGNVRKDERTEEIDPDK